jgi:hypothetical protein
MLQYWVVPVGWDFESFNLGLPRRLQDQPSGPHLSVCLRALSLRRVRTKRTSSLRVTTFQIQRSSDSSLPESFRGGYSFGAGACQPRSSAQQISTASECKPVLLVCQPKILGDTKNSRHANRRTVSPRIVPAYLVGWKRQTPVPARIRTENTLVRPLGYLGLTNPKTGRDRHFMSRRFPPEAFRVPW